MEESTYIMHELVSIITPMYNSENFIGETIKSVINQTYNNWEMIIIDDASSDNSIAIVENIINEESRIKLIKSNIDLGPAKARNMGIELASGRYISFLDSDDLWLPEKLEKQIIFMNEKQCALSYSSYQKIDYKGNYFGEVIIKNLKPSYHDLLKTNHIGCLTAMIDLNIVKEDLYMPLIRKRHDHGLWLLILRKGYIACGYKKILAQFRYRTGSISHDKLSSAYYQWKLYREIENLNYYRSMYYMITWAWNGLLKWLK